MKSIMAAIIAAGVFSLGSMISAPEARAVSQGSFSCVSLDGTKVRDGEYFFEQDCTSRDNRYCKCELSNDEPPININCKEITVRPSLMDITGPKSDTRDYYCSCTIGPNGRRGIRCGISLNP